MKINSLSVQGFGPFKDTQHVDFDAFDDDGIFLMGGKTGAGKSSILDAICFALYDSVPRYDGTKARLRSDHCLPGDPTLVTLEFTAGDIRYRVERSPEYARPKARGDGTTQEKAKAELFELRGSDWHGIAAAPREVGPQIAQIVGLNKDQFLQVILLAQNRFQQFLLAKSEDRQSVLRSLFGTRRFQEYELAVTEQRKMLEGDLGNRKATLAQMLEHAASAARAAGVRTNRVQDAAADDVGAETDTNLEVDPAELLTVPGDLSRATIEPWLGALDAAVSECLAEAGAAEASADSGYLAADAAHDLLLRTEAGQRQRAEARSKYEQLRQDAAALEAVRSEVAAAALAEVVWGGLQGSRRAADAATQAGEKLVAAHDAFLRIHAVAAQGAKDFEDAAAVDDAPPASTVKMPTSAELSALIEETTTERGTLRDGIITERELPALDEQLTATLRAVEVAELELSAAIERATELPALIASDTTALTELRVEAARSDDATTSIKRLERELSASIAAKATEAKLAIARADELAAGQALATALIALNQLRAARLSGHAAELATELRDGEACAVCGSTAHPRPARNDGPVVGQDDIDAAEAEQESRHKVVAASSTAANSLSEQLATHRGVAGEHNLDEISTALEAARALLTSATDAATTADRLTTQIANRRSEHRAIEDSVTVLRTAVAQAIELRTSTSTRCADDTKRVAALRGTHASVAERDANLLTFLELAHALNAALSAATSHTDAAARAAAELATQLAANGFDDAAAAEAAHLSATDRVERERRLKTHDEALATVSATLADPALVNLPVEPVELEGSAAALHEFKEARDAAIAHRATVAGHASSLATLGKDIENELVASANLIERFDVVSRLAATLEGKGPNERKMKLESYVLAAELEQIVAAANGRLSVMSAGRYTLEHDDSIGYRGAQSGLGLSILDSHTGLQRATHSLSGGETFLASLALALGLAEVVTGRAGGIRLDTLFIDEGFGSLDADTLEIAMATLDGLRTGGRTIGLISHVEAMKEQIHASLQVRVSEQGWSTISQPASSASRS